MQRFNLITFNIHSDATLFAKMAKFVSKKKRTIVAIQEKPNASTIKEINDLNKVTLITDPNNRLVFILPKSLNISQPAKIKKENPSILEKRTLEIDLPLEDSSVKIVNVHAWSRKSNAYKNNANLFSRLNEAYKNYSKKIFLGDFNTNPYEEYMRLETYIYADRDFKDVVSSTKDILYNPSWRYLRERANYKGSHYFPLEIPKWNVYDQILISKKLAGKVEGVGLGKVYTSYVKLFHIPNRLGKLSFKPVESYDSDNHISDHMPVLLTLEM